MTKLAALEVGTPRDHIYSEHKNSLRDDLNTALPSALLENGVRPAPFS